MQRQSCILIHTHGRTHGHVDTRRGKQTDGKNTDMQTIA